MLLFRFRELVINRSQSFPRAGKIGQSQLRNHLICNGKGCIFIHFRLDDPNISAFDRPIYG